MKPWCRVCLTDRQPLTFAAGAHYCRRCDPLEQVRARMRAYTGGPFSDEWAELVDTERDLLRARGLSPWQQSTYRPAWPDRRDAS